MPKAKRDGVSGDPLATATHIRPAALAARWGVNLSHIYRQIDRAEIPSRRLGEAILIPLDWVIEWESRATP